MLKMYVRYFKALKGNKKGQGMVEYGLIIGLIAVAVIALLTGMGTQIKALFQSVVNALTTAAGGGV